MSITGRASRKGRDGVVPHGREEARSRAAVVARKAFAAYGLSQLLIAILLWPVRRDLPRLQSTTDPAVFRSVMGRWDLHQRNRYLLHLLPDTLHPLLYAVSLTAAARASLSPSDPRWAHAALHMAPAGAALCDLVENAFHARFLSDPGTITRRSARISGTLTRTKWVLALGTATVLLARTIGAGQAERRARR